MDVNGLWVFDRKIKRFKAKRVTVRFGIA